MERGYSNISKMTVSPTARFHLQARRPDGAWVPAGGPHEFVTLDRPALQVEQQCRQPRSAPSPCTQP